MTKQPAVQVSLEPIVRMKWPDGREAVFTADDVSQFLETLICEELLLMWLSPNGRILSGLEVHLVRDDEGRWVLKPDAIHAPASLIV